MIDNLRVSAVSAAAFVAAAVCSVSAWAGPIEDFDVALKHYQDKKFDLSAPGFKDFIGKYPTHERRPLADLYYGQSLMQLGQFQDAKVVFGQFLRANPDHTDFPLAMYREAECTFFANDLASGTTLFQAFLERFPENELSAWAWYYLGESHLRLGNAERAAEAFQFGLERFPKGPRATETRFGLARAYAALKDLDKAAKAFHAIADDTSNPRAPDALFALGLMQFDAKRYKEAAAAFDEVLEKFPTYQQTPGVALNAGSSYYQLGEFDKALNAFEKAAQSQEHRLMARFWSGQALRSQGKYDEAIAVNKSAYEEFKDDQDAARLLYYWGDCEFRKENFAEAATLFLRFVDTYPTHEFADDSLHYAVEASLKKGELAQAEELHQRFLRDFPRSGLTMLESILHGRILLARVDEMSGPAPPNDEARRLLQSAGEVFENVVKTSKIERTSAWATVLLARTRSKLGDWAGVIAAATPLNEKLDGMEKPEEFSESLYLTGAAAAELQQWMLADSSFDQYLKLTKDPQNAAAALSQIVLARTKAGRLDELDDLWPRFTEAGVPAASMATAIQAAAESAMDSQRFKEASRLFERLEGMPEAGHLHAAARSGLGHAKFNLEEYAGAAEAFGRLVKDPPAEQPVLVADAAFMQGHSLDQAKRPEKAAKAFLDGALLIAGKEGRMGDPPAEPRAAWDAYRCIRGAASQYEALNDIARADDAYAQAWEYLQKLPEDRRADLDTLLFRWASANYKAKNYDRADELFARLLRNHPMSSYADNAAFFLTESMVLSGKADQAEVELNKLLESATTDDSVRPEVLHNLIELTADRQGWEETQKFAKQLIDRFPTSPHRFNARYRLGEATLKSGDAEAAQQEFAELRKTVLEDDASADAHLTEGVWILSAEAEIAASTPDHGQIDRLVEEFHSRFPESKLTYQIDSVHSRSLIRRVPPDVEKARTVLQSIIDSPEGKNTETAAQAHLRLAGTYLLANKSEEYPMAYREYSNVAVRYQDPIIQSAALFKAAEVQELMKKPDGAVSAYRELLSKFPMAAEAEQARARLKALGAAETPPAKPEGDGDNAADPKPELPAIPSPEP